MSRGDSGMNETGNTAVGEPGAAESAPAKASARAPATAPTKAPIISLDRIEKRFEVAGRPLVVFDGMSLEVAERGFLSIVGPSGCGKSTLLKLISGLERASAGHVAFKGAPIAGPPKGMIYVFQQYTRSIFPWSTVLQNVEFGLFAHKTMSRSAAHERCLEYIRLVGLEGYESYYPYQLSGGMQQRVCIARALIGEPDVLLMDEPFSAVDAMTRAILQELIHDIWRRLPMTVLFVTHDVDEAVLLSDRIISLSKAPASVREDVTIELPQPRDQISTRADPRFNDYRQRLFSSIFLQEKSGVG